MDGWMPYSDSLHSPRDEFRNKCVGHGCFVVNARAHLDGHRHIQHRSLLTHHPILHVSHSSSHMICLNPRFINHDKQTLCNAYSRDPFHVTGTCSKYRIISYHAGDDVVQAIGTSQQRASGTLLIHQINRTSSLRAVSVMRSDHNSHIDVDKIAVDIVVEQLGAFCHHIRTRITDLPPVNS